MLHSVHVGITPSKSAIQTGAYPMG